MSEIKRLQRSTRTLAKGNFDPNGRVMVACRFEEALFDEITTIAAASNRSFAQTVRDLIRKGMAQPAIVERSAA